MVPTSLSTVLSRPGLMMQVSKSLWYSSLSACVSVTPGIGCLLVSFACGIEGLARPAVNDGAGSAAESTPSAPSLASLFGPACLTRCAGVAHSLRQTSGRARRQILAETAG